MTLALAASRTERIGLGPGVLIPSLRHPMVTASAIATLVGLVGADRVVVGVGTGFTGRRAMGQKPLKWSEFPSMVRDVQAPAPRRQSWSSTVRPPGCCTGRGRPSTARSSCRGSSASTGRVAWRAAAEMGCGVFASRPQPDADYEGITGVTLLGFGTVLDEGETLDSPRVLDTAGPGVSVAYHAFLEQGDARLTALPNAERFVALAEALDPDVRHLALHEGHLTELNAIDRQVLTAEALRIAPFAAPPPSCPAASTGWLPRA